MITPVIKYAIIATSLITILGGIWYHGYSHGTGVERGKWVGEIEEARKQDAKEIARLRKVVDARKKIVSNAITEIRNVKDETPCQCLDYVAPPVIDDRLRESFNASIRPAPD